MVVGDGGRNDVVEDVLMMEDVLMSEDVLILLCGIGFGGILNMNTACGE